MSHKHAEPGQLMDLHKFGEGKSTALVKESNFEVIRMTIAAGKQIPAHKVDGPITVQCLSGNCTFFVGDEPRKMVPGSWLHLTGGTLHALEAAEQSVMLVTLIRN